MAILVLCAKWLFLITNQTGRFCADCRDFSGIRLLWIQLHKTSPLITSPLLQTPAAPKGGWSTDCTDIPLLPSRSCRFFPDEKFMWRSRMKSSVEHHAPPPNCTQEKIIFTSCKDFCPCSLFQGGEKVSAVQWQSLDSVFYVYTHFFNALCGHLIGPWYSLPKLTCFLFFTQDLELLLLPLIPYNV